MTRKVSLVCVALVMVVVLMLSEAEMAESLIPAGCQPQKLAPCVQYITGSIPLPAKNSQCCIRLRAERRTNVKCFCAYYTDPNTSKYFNSPKAKKLGQQCGVKKPSCPK